MVGGGGGFSAELRPRSTGYRFARSYTACEVTSVFLIRRAVTIFQV